MKKSPTNKAPQSAITPFVIAVIKITPLHRRQSARNPSCLLHRSIRNCRCRSITVLPADRSVITTGLCARDPENRVIGAGKLHVYLFPPRRADN